MNSGEACFKTVSDFDEQPSMAGSQTETLNINCRQFRVFFLCFFSKNQRFTVFVERHRLPLVSKPKLHHFYILILYRFAGPCPLDKPTM